MNTDTDCRKCGAPMPATALGNPSKFNIVTGYRCDCGHWNDLKRRKPRKAKGVKP